MSAAVLLGGAALVGGIAVVALDRLIRDERLAFVLVFTVQMLIIFQGQLPGIDAGVSITPGDAVFAMLLAAAAARALRSPQRTGLQGLLWVAGLFLVISIVRGARLFSPPAAINEARETLYFLGAALYMTTFPATPQLRERLGRAWITFAVIVCGVAFMRWAIVFSGLPLRGYWYDPLYAGLRVIVSNGTFPIAQALLIMVPRVLRGDATRREWQLTALFGSCVLLLQHRSVWAVTLVGGALVVWRHRHVMSRRLVALCIGLAATLAVLSLTLFDTDEVLDQAVRSDAASSSTLEWRTSGWESLIAASGPSSGAEAMFGVPYGNGWQRRVSAGFEVDVQPHNQYLEMALRIGILGLGAILAVGFASASRLRRAPIESGEPLLSDGTLFVLLVTQALYGMVYNNVMDQGLLFGMAASAWAASTLRGRRAQPFKARGRRGSRRRARVSVSRS